MLPQPNPDPLPFPSFPGLPSEEDSYFTLAQKLVVTSSGSPEYSQAVDMAGCNAVCLEATCYSGSGSHPTNYLTLSLQQSNDGENWDPITTGFTAPYVDGIGYKTATSTPSIAGRYVRVKYVTTGTGTWILAVGIRCCRL
jgi:FlaG/FlaF family flagellin (archaellin)